MHHSFLKLLEEGEDLQSKANHVGTVQRLKTTKSFLENYKCSSKIIFCMFAKGGSGDANNKLKIHQLRSQIRIEISDGNAITHKGISSTLLNQTPCRFTQCPPKRISSFSWVYITDVFVLISSWYHLEKLGLVGDLMGSDNMRCVSDRLLLLLVLILLFV